MSLELRLRVDGCRGGESLFLRDFVAPAAAAEAVT